MIDITSDKLSDKLEQIGAVKKDIEESRFTIQNAAEHKARMLSILNSNQPNTDYD